MHMINCDFSHIEGTNCYCSPESADAIRKEMESLPLDAVHYIGTGDYHYVSLFWCEKIAEPFTLVLFDNHPDDQPTAFSSDLLSCGDWVEDARALPNCNESVWIQHSAEYQALAEKAPCKVYLSIDLDVLDPEFAVTDWDQGTMSTDELCEMLADLKKRFTIIGCDICGGISDSKGGTDSDKELNHSTISKILQILE